LVFETAKEVFPPVVPSNKNPEYTGAKGVDPVMMVWYWLVPFPSKDGETVMEWVWVVPDAEFVVELVNVLGVPIVTEPDPVIVVKFIPLPAATLVTVPPVA
jgi:hypothetical protein